MVLRVRPAPSRFPTNTRWTAFSFERNLFFPFIVLKIKDFNCIFLFSTTPKLLCGNYYCAAYQLLKSLPLH